MFHKGKASELKMNVLLGLNDVLARIFRMYIEYRFLQLKLLEFPKLPDPHSIRLNTLLGSFLRCMVLTIPRKDSMLLAATEAKFEILHRKNAISIVFVDIARSGLIIYLRHLGTRFYPFDQCQQ